MSKTDGGPAFPTTPNPTTFTAPGMTLRDYFAAAALTGLLKELWLPKEFELLATRSYQVADAMLAERDK